MFIMMVSINCLSRLNNFDSLSHLVHGIIDSIIGFITFKSFSSIFVVLLPSLSCSVNLMICRSSFELLSCLSVDVT